jgi:cytochrome c biogenesis protein CcdA
VVRTDNESEGAVPRVYRPDHTAGIRHRLKAMLRYFVTGAAVVLTGAVAVAIIAAQFGDEDRTLVTVAWLVVIVALLVAALGLVMTLVLYLVYRRRRADLDAAGAEAEGELQARIHGATRGEG